MPKSRADIQRAYRLRKANELKESERARSQRRRDGQTDQDIAINRKLSQERMARMRTTRKQEQQQHPTQLLDDAPTPYANRSSESKATIKAQRGLPFSPCKMTQVIWNLTQSHCPGLIIKQKHKRNKLSPALKKQATDFYKLQDISRMAPGKRDSVIVKDSQGNKSHEQKQHMVCSIKETYKLFVEEVGKTMSFSTFADLRPDCVLVASKTPRNVCTCILHENFIS